jgi:tetratricopeptide (TPR) repeat protein
MLDLRHRPAIVLVTVGVLVGASVALQAERDRVFPRADVRERFLYLRSGDAMKRLALSYDALAADLYWIRTLQHFGGDRLSAGRGGRYELLYPLLDLTTSLDPRFNIAYRFGAIFLSEPWPGGPGRPDLAVALLKKGIANDPTKWQYMQDIGFVYYWALGDFATAASWFDRAAKVPGAPPWLGPLAATTLAQGGDRRASRFLWQQIAASADDKWMQREAERRLVQLDAMDEIDWLNARIRAYAAAHPGQVVSWDVLLRAGLFRAVPADPTGEPYVLDPFTGLVTVSERSRLAPLPTGEAVRVEPRR